MAEIVRALAKQQAANPYERTQNPWQWALPSFWPPRRWGRGSGRGPPSAHPHKRTRRSSQSWVRARRRAGARRVLDQHGRRFVPDGQAHSAETHKIDWRFSPHGTFQCRKMFFKLFSAREGSEPHGRPVARFNELAEKLKSNFHPLLRFKLGTSLAQRRAVWSSRASSRDINLTQIRGGIEKTRVVIGASEGIRTLDIHLGKVTLYQTELRSLPERRRTA